MRGARALLAVAAVAVVGLLGGCAQAGAAGVAKETMPSVRPSASSTPVAAKTAPVLCDALATPDAVSALVGGTGAPQPLQHLQAGSQASRVPWSVENADGTVCGWGGLATLIVAQGTPQVYIEVVPGLSAQWTSLAAVVDPSAGAAYDGATSRGGSCSPGSRGSCATQVLVGGAWMYVQAISDGRSSFTEQAFHDFVQGVVTRYSSAAPPTPAVPHPKRDCADDRVLSALSAGMGAARTDDRGRPDFSLARAQLDAGQATACPFVAANAPGRGWNALVSVLDGVDPALFAQYRQAVDHPGGTPVDVSALPGTATGVIEETEDSIRVTVDVLDGSTWVQVSTYNETDPKPVVATVSHLIAGGWLG